MAAGACHRQGAVPKPDTGRARQANGNSAAGGGPDTLNNRDVLGLGATILNRRLARRFVFA